MTDTEKDFVVQTEMPFKDKRFCRGTKFALWLERLDAALKEGLLEKMACRKAGIVAAKNQERFLKLVRPYNPELISWLKDNRIELPTAELYHSLLPAHQLRVAKKMADPSKRLDRNLIAQEGSWRFNVMCHLDCSLKFVPSGEGELARLIGLLIGSLKDQEEQTAKSSSP